MRVMGPMPRYELHEILVTKRGFSHKKADSVIAQLVKKKLADVEQYLSAHA